MTGNELLSVRVPPSWSKSRRPGHRQGRPAPDREGAVVDDLAVHRQGRPGGDVTVPSLTTWPLIVAGPPTPELMLTLPSAALVSAPGLIARVSP